MTSSDMDDPIEDVANSKLCRQLNKILNFLPTLHPRNQQGCLQENSVTQYACKTKCNPVSPNLSVFLIHFGSLLKIKYFVASTYPSIVSNFIEMFVAYLF